MVRLDHEDGGVLNPDEPGKTGPVVRKSSPLGRKPKARKAEEPAETETPAASEVPEAAETPEAAEILAEAEALEEAEALIVGAEVSYRDRRSAARRTAREAAVDHKSPMTGSPRGWRIAATVVGALILVAGIVASVIFGVGLQRISHERDLRGEYAAFARQVVVQMTTLDPDNADAMYKLAMEKTSGRAQQMFRENMKQVTDMVRSSDAVTKTTVLTEAVSEASDDEGVVLMVVGWESRTADEATEPLFQTFRYKVSMTRLNDELKVTDLEFVW